MAEFQTVYPGWYVSRTVHIHVKVRTYDTGANKTHEFTTQLYFDEATNDRILSKAPYSDRGARRVRNESDGLYAARQADGTMVGSHLLMTFSGLPKGTGSKAEFALALKLD
jgi:protocatechuate 3,4-dioxygenase beta subunit